MAHNLSESLRDPANGPLLANEYERTQTAIGCRSHEAIRTRLCMALVARFEAIQIACTGKRYVSFCVGEGRKLPLSS